MSNSPDPKVALDELVNAICDELPESREAHFRLLQSIVRSAIATPQVSGGGELPEPAMVFSALNHGCAFSDGFELLDDTANFYSEAQMLAALSTPQARPDGGEAEPESLHERVEHYAALVKAFQNKMRVVGPLTPPEDIALSGLIAAARAALSTPQARPDGGVKVPERCDHGRTMDEACDNYGCDREAHPAPAPDVALVESKKCGCTKRDAWRCAVEQCLSSISCPCKCHQYLTAAQQDDKP